MNTKNKTFEEGVLYLINMIKNKKLATEMQWTYIIAKDKLEDMEKRWQNKLNEKEKK